MIEKIKKRVFEIVQTAENGDKASRACDITLITLITINVVMLIVETFSIPDSMRNVANTTEAILTIIFTVEYVIRLWCADIMYPNMSRFRARLRYMVSFIAIVDLVSILPFYLPFVVSIDLSILRALRIVRLFRLLKMSRYVAAFSTIGTVLKRKSSQLISSVSVVMLLLVIASVLMYNVENEAQPDVFKNAFSALWWAIATLTTVGYGDIYPVTVAGKALSSVIATLGIVLVAVPTGIISAGFMELSSAEKNVNQHNEDNSHEKCKKAFCPYCGNKLDDE